MSFSQSHIADVVHGTIAYTELEKRTLGTTLLNRLHNVLQNSTLYLAYPCNRTSRFSHSVGCMHLAGSLFWNGILNADQDALNSFIGAFRVQIDAAFQKAKEEHTLQLADLRAENVQLDGGDWTFFALREQSFITRTTNSADCATLNLALAVVRLAALLHDLGHPPFSHVTEEALKTLNEKLTSTNKLKNTSGELLRNVFSQAKQAEKEFHEKVGIHLIENLLKDILKQEVSSGEEHRSLYATHNKSEHQNQWHAAIRRALLVSVIRDLVINVLTAKADTNPELFALREILDSDLDADRLDYVVRDINASGVSKGGLQYERLIKGYRLFAGPFKFLPSARALSAIEEFFQKRTFSYKYIIFHHRVAKMDGLLREVLVKLGEKELQKPKPAPGASNRVLDHEISRLWEILAEDSAFYSNLKDYFAQWDDAWLLSLLRKKLYTLPSGSDAILEIQLQELLANRKYYVSVNKRADLFNEIDMAFRAAARPHLNHLTAKHLRFFAGLGKKTQKQVLDLFRLFKATIRTKVGVEPRKHRLPAQPRFAISLLFDILYVGNGVQATTPLNAAADGALNALSECVRDIMVITKRLKPGLRSELGLWSGDEITSFADISATPSLLLTETQLFPPFFLFVLPKRGVSGNVDLKDIRTVFGQQLFTTFKNMYTYAKKTH